MRAANSILDITGNRFVVDDHNRDQLIMLAEYFSNQNTSRLDRRKGNMILGDVGSGKTVVMEAFRKVAHRPLEFGMKSTPAIAQEFIEGGPSAIKYYMLPYKPDSGRLNNYNFDDLATEDNKKYYGNESNVMADIIYARYELWRKSGLLTHFTTNKTAEDLEKIYGDRAFSRLCEMCNWIPLTGPDRRKAS